MTPALFAAADPGLSLTFNGGGSSAVKLFLLMTVLSFATALLISVTSFTRIVIVLSFLRQALGTPQLPPNQILIALSLALSAFVMAPTFSKVKEAALTPYLEDRLSAEDAADVAQVPVKAFMLKQTRAEDLALFYDLAGLERPARGDDVPLHIAVPAFMVSELTTAFRMGLYIFLPLLLVDLLVSAILMSLGMMMVPPNLISLPLKVGVFLLADGWNLVVGALARSFA